jgi:uncharacterized protein YndB with AHSA1/START domain
MAKDALDLRTVLPVSPARALAAWIDAAEHARFTGGEATSEPRVGGKFTAWDGYIEGSYLVLEPARLVMTWRTSEFPADHPDSCVEVRFAAIDGGTELHLVHTGIPEGQGVRYESGWAEFYFQPLGRHFAPSAKPAAKPAAKKPAAKKPAAKKPAAKKPAAKKPAAKKPAAKKPAAKKPAAKKPAAKKPAAKKPAAKKPAGSR